MNHYAILNSENICTSLYSSQKTYYSDNYIYIGKENLSVLGKRYNDGEWENLVRIDPTPEPTDTELIMQTLFDSELRDFEGTEERALLAQQMTDIELAILGGYTS